MSKFRGESRRFAGNILLYVIPSIALRGLSVLFTPVYTAAMAPDEFGVVAIANTVTGLLGIIFGLSIHGAMARFDLEIDGEAERRRMIGGIVLFMTVVPTIACAALHLAGMAGLLDVFRTIPFEPYIVLAMWTALLGIHSNWPTAIFMTREQPGRVALFNIAAVAVQTVATLVLVVWLRRGALGVLHANLISQAVMALVSLAVVSRLATFSRSFDWVRRALRYALPLVPHLLANWVLALSDRLILERYTTAAEVGTYSLAYLFNVGVGVLAASAGSAFAPMATRQLKNPETAGYVPRLGTYGLAAIFWFALCTATFAPEAIALATPPSYHGASRYVPWVVLGAAFQGAYLISSTGTWFSMRTAAVPLVTLLAGAVNIGFNLLLVTRIGPMAAALSTAVAYFVAFAAHTWLAAKLHPIAWPYRQWAAMSGASVACYVLAFSCPSDGAIWTLLWKVCAVCILYPLSMVGTGVLTRVQVLAIPSLIRRGRKDPVHDAPA